MHYTNITLSRGAIILLGSRPAIGKTYIASMIAKNLLANSEAVCFISLACPKEHLIEQNFDISHDKNLIIKDDLETIEEIEEYIRHTTEPYNITTYIIDYLQLLGSKKSFDSLSEKVDYKLSVLKNLAKEFDISFLLTSQLDRALDSKSDKRPQIVDIREKNLSCYCDKIFFLYKDDSSNINIIQAKPTIRN